MHSNTSSVLVEVSLRQDSNVEDSSVRSAVSSFLSRHCYIIRPGPLCFTSDKFLSEHCDSITISDPSHTINPFHKVLFFWQVTFDIAVFHLHTTGGESEHLEEEDDNAETPALTQWPLPSTHFAGSWEALLYEEDIKSKLLQYTTTALRFSDANVNPNFITWNRVVLLHGPPGSGKTSLCKALAQKLSIVLHSRFSTSHLVEINAHSLFSRWFSESGKLVLRMFDTIADLLTDPNTFITVLIDEVESLSASRKAAMSGSEPSDAIRVVNALLTQIDRVGKLPNVLIMCTTNITAAVDLAFVDRADLKLFLGLPPPRIVYTLFSQSIDSLMNSGLIKKCKLASWDDRQENEVGKALEDVANVAHGFSGRALRKLPFIAFAFYSRTSSMNLLEFLDSLKRAIIIEKNNRELLDD
ncbi:hypothetical protein P9112_008589 [Eukaryota sp. TZLM1-RC]